MFRLIICVMLVSLSLPSFARSPADEDCTIISLLPCEIGALTDTEILRLVAADGDHFCYATNVPASGGLKLVWGRAAPGTAPEILGEWLSPAGTPSALACDGALAAVAFRHGTTAVMGWQLVDFSAPAAPVLLSETASASRIYDLELADGLACIAGYGAGFRLFDISTPAAPVETTPLPAVDAAVSVACDAGVWFVSGSVGFDSFLRSYDLSTPAAPTLLGEITSPIGYDQGLMFREMSARNGVLAVRMNFYTTDWLGSVINTYSLRILDVTDPAASVQVGAFSYGSTATIAPTVGNGMVYAPVGSTLRYLVDDGAGWTEAYRLGTAEEPAPVCVAGGHLMGCDGYRLVEYTAAMLVSSPIASSTPVAATYANDLELTDTHAFISCYQASGGGIGDDAYGLITVYDLSDPEGPVMSHSMGMPYPQLIDEIVVHGDYLFTNGGVFHWPTGNLQTTGIQMYRDGRAYGNALYAVLSQGFRVYDIATPEYPSSMGDYLGTETLTALTLDGSTLHVFGEAMTTYDVSMPTAPVLVASFRLPATVRGASRSGDLLYLASDYGLLVYDVSSPAAPSLLCQRPLANCWDIELSGTTAYISALGDGLLVFDVADPANPVRLGDLSSGSDELRVDIRDDLIYALSRHQLTAVLPECAPVANEDGGETPGGIASALRLAPPYPNPFNPSTTLKYELSRPGAVSLSIHDAAGRRLCTLVDGRRASGPHTAVWHGHGDGGATAAAGVYFARLVAEDGVAIQKLVLLK